MNKIFHISFFLLYFVLTQNSDAQDKQQSEFTNKQLIAAFYSKEERLIESPKENFKELLNIYGTILGLTEEQHGKNTGKSAFIFTKIANLYRLVNMPKEGLEDVETAVKITKICEAKGISIEKDILWYVIITKQKLLLQNGSYESPRKVALNLLSNVDEKQQLDIYFELITIALRGSNNPKSFEDVIKIFNKSDISRLENSDSEYVIYRISNIFSLISHHYKRLNDNNKSKFYFNKSINLLAKNNLKDEEYYYKLISRAANLTYVERNEAEEIFNRSYKEFYSKTNDSNLLWAFYYRKFYHYYKHPDPAEGIELGKDILKNIELDPKQKNEILKFLGSLQRRAMDYTSAVPNLTEALRYKLSSTSDFNSPDLRLIYLDLSEAHKALNNQELSEYYSSLGFNSLKSNNYLKYPGRDSTGKPFLINFIEFAANRGNFEEAIKYIDYLLKLYSKSNESDLEKIYKYLLMKGNYMNFISRTSGNNLILSTLTEIPKGKKYYYLRGFGYSLLARSYLHQGNFKESKKYLDISDSWNKKIDFTDYDNKSILCDLLLMNKEYKKCLTIINVILTNDADLMNMLETRGRRCLINFLLGNYETASKEVVFLSEEINLHMIGNIHLWKFRRINSFLEIRSLLDNLMINCLIESEGNNEDLVLQILKSKGIFHAIERLRQENANKFKDEKLELAYASARRKIAIEKLIKEGKPNNHAPNSNEWVLSEIELIEEKTNSLKENLKTFKSEYGKIKLTSFSNDICYTDFFGYRDFKIKDSVKESIINKKLKPDSYLGIVLDKNNATIDLKIIQLGNKNKLDNQIKKLFQNINTGKITKPLIANNISELSKTFQPWINVIIESKNNQVRISPTATLWHLPFEMLKHDNDYLIKKMDISYLNSFLSLNQIKPNGQKLTTQAGKDYVVISNPNYDHDPYGETLASTETNASADYAPIRAIREIMRSKVFKQLNYAEIEGKSISDILGNVHLITGVNATEEYLDKLRSPELIHFATHAFYLPKPNEKFEINPFTLSGIALAGANVTANPNRMTIGNYDGILSAAEAGIMSLKGTKLVVLSACDSALGQDLHSEGFFSLRKAFNIAGAKTVVGANWSLNDKITAEFMKQFYEKIKEGKPISQALRETKLNFISSIVYNNPYFWAPFTLTGQW
ncbi:MAG: CHAT domain-containing protein [Candidatus Marinimicrobia bacterium]|jgi:CHAT domain-containing protein|nr:CHAT domain-containing protein [Candidatus Neomarinimicrobiota bacterium]